MKYEYFKLTGILFLEISKLNKEVDLNLDDETQISGEACYERDGR